MDRFAIAFRRLFLVRHFGFYPKAGGYLTENVLRPVVFML